MRYTNLPVAGNIFLMSVGLLLLSAAPASISASILAQPYALNHGQNQVDRQTSPDNSGTNTAQDQGKTADQQPNDRSDLAVAAKIRRLVVADKTISTYGHNVKIIVMHGAVTLKGPVHSEEEKQTIDQKAAQVVGQDKVTDHMTVKP